MCRVPPGNVTFNGSATDKENNIRTYTIKEGSNVLKTGSDPSIFKSTLTLAASSYAYTFTFEAVDANGLKGSDTIIVKVNKTAATNTAPVVNAGTDKSVTITSGTTANVTFSGSATDKENNIKTYSIKNGSTVLKTGTASSVFASTLALAAGSHTLTFEAVDAGNLVGRDTVVVNVSPAAATNTAPVVNAGTDKTVALPQGLATVNVVFSGTATDRENNIRTYNIKEGSLTLKTGTSSSVFASSIALVIGTHTLVFEAIDAGNLVGRDTIVVTVTAAAQTNTAPVVSAGSDISVTASNNVGTITLAGSASDAQNNITSYSVKQGSTVLKSGTTASIFQSALSFAPGSYVLTLEAKDAGGLVGSDSVNVTVNQPATTPNPGYTVNAGPDIIQDVNDLGNFTNKITLKGSASGTVARLIWRVNGVVVRDSTDPSHLTHSTYITQGRHLVTLDVFDGKGAQANDSLWVEVKPILGGAKAVAAAGGVRIITDVDGDGKQGVRMVGSVVSNLSGLTYKWVLRGQVLKSSTNKSVLTDVIDLPLGSHNVLLQVFDSSNVKIAEDNAKIEISGAVVDSPAFPVIPANFNVNDYLTPTWGDGPSHWKDQASMRFHCKPSHLLYDDPILFPGQKGKSHLHLFFGNKVADANSTYESLRKNGVSSCHGGPLNRSAYWMPAMVNENGKVILPDAINIYYKTQPGAPKIPRGLRLIFGADASKSLAENKDTYAWKCSSGSTKHQTIPEVNCPPTTSDLNNQIMVEVPMPHCWDGKQFDSKDHRSHVVHGVQDGWGASTCPASHPVIIPSFTLIAAFSHTGYAEYSKWRLSSDHIQNPDGSVTKKEPGSTMHADWFGAWDDGIMKKWLDGCINNFASCSGGNLDSTHMMKWDPNWSWSTNPRIVDPPAKPLP